MTTAVPAPSIGGPVSRVLEQELRTWVRRHGIVVWLDGSGAYTPFVDRLRRAREAGGLPYRVEAFRGSFLELMTTLEPVTDGAVAPRLLLHLPGFTEERVRASPLLELYAAGARFRKALATLIAEAAAGEVPPAAIEAFLANSDTDSDPDLDGLENADRWLEARLSAQDASLEGRLRTLPAEALVAALRPGSALAREVTASPAARDAVYQHLAGRLGLSRAWWTAALDGDRGTDADLAFVAASWALVVEYADDLRRPPRAALVMPAAELAKSVIAACRGVAQHLRASQGDIYERTADAAESWLGDEIATARAEDLGKIDTFRFEDETVLGATLAAVSAQDWRAADGYARARLDSASFWLARDPHRQATWSLLAAVAHLGLRIAEAAVVDAATVEAAAVDAAKRPEALMDDYVARGAAVDRAHRELEQLRADRLHPEVPHFVALRALLDDARAHWRAWADRWALAFNAACRRHGFLGPAATQQRSFFDDVVVPMSQESGGSTVLFAVDALRFEMAQVLVERLAAPARTRVQLAARLAELPTTTEVGMNVMPPLAAGGRLRLVLDGSRIVGFHSGQLTVKDPKSRQRQMHARVGGATCPWLSLEEVVGREVSSLRQTLGGSNLLVVHSREIDQAGESDVGALVFEHVLHKLLAAWRLLHEAGARRFVLTSDHGFLLLDDRAESIQSHGRAIDPKRRHVLSSVGADHDGEVRVALRDLGYAGAEGHLMFPESTAVFDTGRRSMRFVHGGNSLQERVVPVLTIVHRGQGGGSNQRYRIEGRRLEPLGSFHSLGATVVVGGDQQSLDFVAPATLEVALRVPEDPEVQIELHQVRGAAARLTGSLIEAAVGEPFELFFRLRGRGDRQVAVELYHPSGRAEVAPTLLDDRFAISSIGVATAGDEAVPEIGAGWLESLPAGGIREFFGHLEAHGAVTEVEAVALLGSARALRKLSLEVEALARKAPFSVRIEVIGGLKRYVKGSLR